MTVRPIFLHFIPFRFKEKDLYTKTVKEQINMNITKKLLWEIFITFLKIGPVTFGGGYAMIPLIEREVVYRKNG